MKTIIFVFLAFLMASCRSLSERNEESIDNMPVEVRAHVRTFLAEGAKRGKKLKLKKLRIELTKGVDYNGVYISPDHKIRLNYECKRYDYDLEGLVFHELGHALLKRDHVEKYDSSGHSLTYMLPVWNNEVKDLPGREMLLNEIFN